MSYKKARRIFSAGFFCLLFTGCAAVVSSVHPGAGTDLMAHENGFEKLLISTRPFLLNSYVKIKTPGEAPHIYIEGDGLAWFSKTRLSDDPTPRRALVLKLALRDEAGNVIYLARPCQYVFDAHCQSEYWASRRFSKEVIDSMNQAVDQLKEKAKADKIHLIGYSGGGAVAVLVAARRKDVASLRTIAGNLDHGAVSRLHGVSPLSGSLNAIDDAEKISSVPQEHFVGGKDKIIPSFIARKFAKKSGGPCVKITEVAQASHESGWSEAWPSSLPPLDC